MMKVQTCCNHTTSAFCQEKRADQWEMTASTYLALIENAGARMARAKTLWNPWKLRRALRDAEAELAQLWTTSRLCPIPPWQPGGIPTAPKADSPVEGVD